VYVKFKVGTVVLLVVLLPEVLLPEVLLSVVLLSGESVPGEFVPEVEVVSRGSGGLEAPVELGSLAVSSLR